jgi:hypothetical protein
MNTEIEKLTTDLGEQQKKLNKQKNGSGHIKVVNRSDALRLLTNKSSSS